MRLGLGNALGRQMVINPDGLSLDLAFAADKTLTARKGPTPTFTRASTATYYGPFISRGGVTIPPTGLIVSGRTEWRIGDEYGGQWVYYTGDRWAIENISGEIEVFTAAAGNEFRPEQADWSASGTSVTTSNTFGIIKSAINEPRFDHDPVTLACKGLLIEESRTNLATQSQEFENAVYSKAAVGVAAATITANNDTAPDGTLTADLVNFSATTAINQQGMLYRTVHTATIGQSVTLSVFMRVPSGTATVFIALSEGSPQTGQSVACNVTTTWQRFSVTRTALAATQIYIELGPDTRTAMGQTAVQPAASVLLWGAQFEVGAFPTSYIPTTTVALTRSADVCSITGTDFTSFYNNPAGTILSEAMIANLVGNNRGTLQIDNGSHTHIIRHNYSISVSGFNSTISANDAADIIAITAGTASVIQKRITAYQGTSFAAVTNGGAITTRTRTMPVGLNAIRIGNLVGSFYLNGHIAAIRFFKKRLPDAKIQAFTT